MHAARGHSVVTRFCESATRFRMYRRAGAYPAAFRAGRTARDPPHLLSILFSSFFEKKEAKKLYSNGFSDACPAFTYTIFPFVRAKAAVSQVVTMVWCSPIRVSR